jgi:hypothetical protein
MSLSNNPFWFSSGATSAGGGGAVYPYSIDQSLRFNADDEPSLTKAYITAQTNTKILTISVWVKRSNLGIRSTIIFAKSGSSAFLHFNTSDNLVFNAYNTGYTSFTSDQVFRDTSAWYHIVAQADSQDQTGANIHKVYVNGELITGTTSGTFVPDDTASRLLQNGVTTYIGDDTDASTYHFDGYLAEMHVIDGSVVAPTEFGETNNGVWVPKAYSGSYGTNGFYLSFADSAAIGDDLSGNTNDFTATNLAASDVVPDSPTNNMAVLSAVNKYTNAASDDVREGGLEERGNSSGYAGTVTFDATDTDGYYYEVTHTGTPGAGCTHGMMNFTDSINQYGGIPGDSDRSGWWGVYRRGAGGGNTFWYYLDGVQTGDLSVAGAANDVWMYLIKDGKFYIGRNGTWFNSADPSAGTGYYDSGLTGTDWTIFSGNGYNVTGGHKIRVDRNLWDYGDASYKEIKASNIADPAIGPQLASGQQSDDYFEPILYTGTGATQHIGSGGAQHPIDVVTVGNSLRLNDDDTSYLSVTYSDAGTSTAIGTFSFWIKRGELGGSQDNIYFEASGYGGVQFRSDKLSLNSFDSSNTQVIVESDTTITDTSAWHHCVVAINGTNGTVKFYIDGVETSQTVTVGSLASGKSWDILSYDSRYNFYISSNSSSNCWDGYLAEYYYIDGQELDPTSFGQYGSNGYWIPKAYSGTYGDNGFYLDFSDNSTANALGTDSSGNANNFSATNIATTDQMGDSPTQNFATLDPNYVNSTTQTFAEGNLDFSSTQTGTNPAVVSTFAVNTGKWYWEVYIRTDAGSNSVGIAKKPNNLQSDSYALYNSADSYQYQTDGNKRNNSSSTSYGDAWTTGDIIGVALDLDAGTVKFYKNGTVQNSGTPAFTSLSSTEGFTSYSLVYQGGAQVYNFGADDSFAGNATGGAGAADGNGYGSFYYTPPTGFLALVDDNIPVEGITSPDFTWIKSRTSTYNHQLVNSVVGYPNGTLLSDASDAEYTAFPRVDSRDYNGFTVSTPAQVNLSGGSYVSWNWKAGGTASTIAVDTYSTGVPSIASSVSANQDAGFSIVSYTGNLTTGATVGHGLLETPEIIFVKNRDSAQNWTVWNKDLTSERVLYLNLTAAENNAPANFGTHTNQVFGVDNGVETNGSGNAMIAYCFHSVEGYSKVGSYVGNANANGPFVYTGFRPAFLLTKMKTNGSQWTIIDNTRNTYNPVSNGLVANTNAAEVTGSSAATPFVDFVSNGFKIRSSQAQMNQNNDTFIYLAFAEQPFKYANAR